MTVPSVPPPTSPEAYWHRLRHGHSGLGDSCQTGGAADHEQLELELHPREALNGRYDPATSDWPAGY